MNCKIFDEKKLIAKFKVFVMTLLIISLLRFASHSKIKPCKPRISNIHGESANGSLNQL